eukprot:CAMPEP_0168445782 /NCGR_PEP_ID=MMETSP0228-20121227/45742_1 /TAXON_ID=133427 /ORGANISM="Protoceratium reticulatum, Strain CCCM 535 (=CCMP 1889)" /LENGTH=207 /DNA_ID=CAMNT_0008460267 /DNA_START=21 /DNA_END=641 /DNA_ORIENTATION=-
MTSARSPAARALRALIALAGLAGPASAGSLRATGRVTAAEAEARLVAELVGNSSAERLAGLEAALRPSFAALPKEAGGQLGHQAVRYTLHRLLLQRHGWFVVGLEPSDEAPPPYLQGEWVPSYLQGLLEQRLSSRGMSLRELAALAAALEDLVHGETAWRLDAAYALHGLQPAASLQPEVASDVLTTYLMLFLGANFSTLAQGDFAA